MLLTSCLRFLSFGLQVLGYFSILMLFHEQAHHRRRGLLIFDEFIAKVYWSRSITIFSLRIGIQIPDKDFDRLDLLSFDSQVQGRVLQPGRTIINRVLCLTLNSRFCRAWLITVRKCHCELLQSLDITQLGCVPNCHEDILERIRIVVLLRRL